MDNWKPAQVDPTIVFGASQGSYFTAVAYGNGRYVAVGANVNDDGGVIQTSEDGVNWTLRTHGDYSIFDLYDVVFANGIFVAAGWDFFNGRNIYTSTNGIDWSPHTTAMSDIYGLAYGNGLFVAVGDGFQIQTGIRSIKNVYYSFDTSTWTGTDSGFSAADTHTLTDVAYGNGKFIAVDGMGYIYSLIDQTRVTNALASSFVSFCNGRFFIPVGPGTNLISINGLSWSVLTNSTGSSFGHVVSVGGTFVALADSRLIFSSTDGTNWTQRNFQRQSNDVLGDLVSGNRNVVLTGYANPPHPAAIPVAYVSDPFVALKVGSNFPPQITISGLTGRTYRVEMLTGLDSTNWQSLTNLNLTNGPVTWSDSQATNSARFYRVKLMP